MKTIKHRILKSPGALALLGCVSLYAAPALAQSQVEIDIDSSDRESVNNPDILDFVENRFKIVGGSYQVRAVNGTSQQGAVQASRPYFAFPLSGARGQSKPLVGATLTFDHPTNSVSGTDDPTETMALFAVEDVSLQDLRRLPGPATSSASDLALARRIFDDLGSGNRFGYLTASAQNNGKLQTIRLNSNAVKAISDAIAAGESDFIIGGALASGRLPGDTMTRGKVERIFQGSDTSAGADFPPTKLTLIFADEPLEPAAAPVLGGLFGLGLLGTGLGGVGLAARRRKRK